MNICKFKGYSLDTKGADYVKIVYEPKKQEELTGNKNILFEITDNELLRKTGGIIQGMSGSPIIQGNNIVGAVTHVVIDNPLKGYGILITNMLEEGEK